MALRITQFTVNYKHSAFLRNTSADRLESFLNTLGDALQSRTWALLPSFSQPLGNDNRLLQISHTGLKVLVKTSAPDFVVAAFRTVTSCFEAEMILFNIRTRLTSEENLIILCICHHFPKLGIPFDWGHYYVIKDLNHAQNYLQLLVTMLSCILRYLLKLFDRSFLLL